MISEEAVARIRQRIVRGPFGEYMDFIVDELGEDRSVIRLPLRDQMTNTGGIVHGGATAALVDTAATAAAWATPRAGNDTMGTTVGFAINYLAPGKDDDLIAEATALQRGRNLTIVDVMVRDGAGRNIAKAQVTYKIGL